jgi:ankyrin repeat protein
MVDALLLTATMRAHVACMKLLLKHGADCYITLPGWVDNLVSIAIFARSIDAVKLLIDAGVDFDRAPVQTEYPQQHANTPLAIAILEEHIPPMSCSSDAV